MRGPVLLALVCYPLLAAAFVRRGDVVVTQPSGLVRLDPATGVAIEIPATIALRRPTGVVVLPDGDLLIADWNMPRMDFGTVVRVRPLDGTTEIVAKAPQMVNPFAFVRTPGGRIVLADIDAGSHVQFPRNVLRKGVIEDFDPATGTTVQLLGDCCEFNPVALDFASPTRLVIADAGCCAYQANGNVAIADVTTGAWRTLASGVPWRDPFAVVVAEDGATAYVTEASVAQPGPPAVWAIDLGGGLPRLLAEGPPLVFPTGIVREDPGRLLVADAGASAILRVDATTGGVGYAAAGPPFIEPASLATVDVGDVVSGVTPSVDVTRACAATAADDATRFAARVLRCVGQADPTRCLRSLSRRWPPRRPVAGACPACTYDNRLRMTAIAEALLRTPGRRLDCTGSRPADRTGMARAAARLYARRSRCDAAYLGDRDRDTLRRCQDAADARYVRRTRLRCDAAAIGQTAAEIASVADVAIGLAYCAP